MNTDFQNSGKSIDGQDSDSTNLNTKNQSLSLQPNGIDGNEPIRVFHTRNSMRITLTVASCRMYLCFVSNKEKNVILNHRYTNQ